MGVDEKRILERLYKPRLLDSTKIPKEMVLPAYGGYSLANVPATVLAHFAAKGVTTPRLAPEVVGDQLKGARKLVVLLVDALGYLALKRQMKADRGLGFNALARAGTYTPLTSIFPTTTAACLSTLHTGLTPIEHGITGYRIYMPDRGAIMNMIRLSPDSDERMNQMLPAKDDAGAILGVPTVHQRLAKAGVKSTCLIQKPIANSGLSTMLYAGSKVSRFINASDMCVQIRELVSADKANPECIWAYWGAVDEILHEYGTGTPQVESEVRSLGYILKRELIEPLARKSKGKTVLMVLSDHGQVQVDRESVVSTKRFRKLSELLVAPPTGTGRSPYLHVREGMQERTRSYLSRNLKDRALVFDTRKVIGLWGSGIPRSEVSGRLGDLLVLMRNSNTLFYPYRSDSKPFHLLGGRHGGLNEEEALIPFFCARF